MWIINTHTYKQSLFQNIIMFVATFMVSYNQSVINNRSKNLV